MVKVKRMTLKDYNDLVSSLGKTAEFFQVPSTKDQIKFHGVFTTPKRDEIAVAWPVDRPDYAQTEYSDKYKCGFPVEEFELKDNLNGRH